MNNSFTKTHFFAFSFLISNELALQSCNINVAGKRAFGISMVFSVILEINMLQVIPMEAIQNGNIPQARYMDI